MKNNPAVYMGISLIIGIAVGILTDNVGLSLVLGVAIGAALYQTRQDSNKS